MASYARAATSSAVTWQDSPNNAGKKGCDDIKCRQAQSEGSLLLPPPLPSQIHTLGPVPGGDMSMTAALGTPGLKVLQGPGCMAVTAYALSHVTKQAWLVVGAGDVQ